jgi:hypothetical protein
MNSQILALYCVVEKMLRLTIVCFQVYQNPKLENRLPKGSLKGTVSRDFSPPFFMNNSIWGPDKPPKIFSNFIFKFTELLEF